MTDACDSSGSKYTVPIVQLHLLPLNLSAISAEYGSVVRRKVFRGEADIGCSLMAVEESRHSE